MVKIEVHYQSHEQTIYARDYKEVYEVTKFRVDSTYSKKTLILKLVDGSIKRITLYYEYSEDYATYRKIS